MKRYISAVQTYPCVEKYTRAPLLQVAKVVCPIGRDVAVLPLYQTTAFHTTGLQTGLFAHNKQRK